MCTFTKKTQKEQVSTMAFCCQLLLLPRPAASHYAMLLPLLVRQDVVAKVLGEDPPALQTSVQCLVPRTHPGLHRPASTPDSRHSWGIFQVYLPAG